MRHEVLLKSLHKIREELGGQQEKSITCIEKCRAAVDRLTEEVRRVKEKEACAIHEHQEIEAEQNALLAHLNSLREQPQALVRAVDRLRGEHSRTYHAWQEAEAAVQRKEQELREAKTLLAVKEKEHETLRKEHGEVLEQIRSVSADS
jgi:chromosome segregation ATPase